MNFPITTMQNIHRLALEARAIARRNATLNHVRISIKRLLRIVERGSEVEAEVQRLREYLENVINRNEEWNEFEEKLLTASINKSKQFATTTSHQRAVFLLTELGLTAEEIGNLLFVTRRGVEGMRYRHKQL